MPPEGALPLFIGVDVGTSETKGAVVASDGSTVAQARRPHALLTPEPGFAEHDPETAWWQGLCSVVGALLAAPGVERSRLAAIACSGIGPCVLPTDADLRPLSMAILYGVDTRAEAQILRLATSLGADEIEARAGCHLSSQSAGPKIAWLRDEQPEVHRGARWFLTCQSFLVARLTGQVVIDRTTASHFHPLYDRRTDAWNTAGCEDFVRPGQLARIVDATAVAGTVTPTAAAATGLPAGLPVIAGTADAPAEAVASGVLAPGDQMVMYGSSSFVIQVTDRPSASAVLWPSPFALPATHSLSGGSSTAGTLIRWFEREVMGAEATPETHAAFSSLADAAAPGARGLLALPYFHGERTPLFDAGARGVILGLGLEHTRADLARAVVEGVAHSMADVLLAFDRDGHPPSRIRAVGGGTRNRAWVQAVSDIYGADQEVVETLGACQGDAALAALAVGALDDPEECRAWVSPRDVVRPRAELRDLYRRDHERFGALYARTRDLLPDPARAEARR